MTLTFPPSYGAMFIWLLVGPIGIWAGASARYYLAERLGARAGPVLIGVGAFALLVLLVWAAVAASEDRRVWYDWAAPWSIVLLAFYTPFVVGNLTRNRWIILGALPAGGLLGLMAALVFEGIAAGPQL